VIDHPIMVLAQQLGEMRLDPDFESDDEDDDVYFMKGLSMLTSMEPCFMCAMALVHSRIKRVYFMKEC
jgi:tRNA-specific adenosine deaminase 3